jgi:UDP-glucose 4-epimerase
VSKPVGSGIVVFGGAGFIGSHIVDEAMTQGSNVTVFDNLSEGKMENIIRWRGHPNFTFVKGDIRDFEQVRRTCDMKFGVFHLAACSRIQPSIKDPLMAFTQNYIGTANVLEACRQGGVSRVVYSASSSAYGRKSDDYCVDDRTELEKELGMAAPPGLDEMCPTECLNPYSLSKKGGEELCDLYNQFYGLSTCALRYFNVYGPRHQESGDYATVIAIFRKQRRHGRPLTIVGDGTQRRDFTFVGDVVRANMMALYNRDAVGIYNVGAGQNYSINELAAKIGGDIEYIPPRLGEANVTLANCDKAKSVLGWTPSVTLDQGLGLIEKYEQAFSPSGLILPGGF